jgi:hypothetical protein
MGKIVIKSFWLKCAFMIFLAFSIIIMGITGYAFVLHFTINSNEIVLNTILPVICGIWISIFLFVYAFQNTEFLRSDKPEPKQKPVRDEQHEDE